VEPMGIGKRGVRSIVLSVLNGDISKALRYEVICGNATLPIKAGTIEKLWTTGRFKDVIPVEMDFLVCKCGRTS